MIVKPEEFRLDVDNQIINTNSKTIPWEYLPDSFVQTTITSPPYFGLRNYGKDGNQEEVGIETDVDDYLDNLYKIFKEVYRITKKDGTFWLNIADTYAMGHMNGKVGPNAKKGMDSKQERYGVLAARRKPVGTKRKDLIGIPWLCAFMLREMGWYLRSDIIWAKKSCMPEPQAKDRPWKSYEHIFLLSKSPNYVFNQIKEETGGPKRDVWVMSHTLSKDGHPACFAKDLVINCILQGSNEGDIIFDPFGGINTVGVWANKMKRKSIVLEINPKFCEIGEGLMKESEEQIELFS